MRYIRIFRGLAPRKPDPPFQGVERVVLQNVYAALMSKDVTTMCLPDCRSLAVNMRTEASQTYAQPAKGILIMQPNSKYFPLGLLMDVNITMPDLSKLNQVIRHLYTM